MRDWLEGGAPSAGLFAGAAAWLVSTQLNYAIAPLICAADWGWLVPASTLLLTTVSLAGGYLSWRAWVNAEPAPAPDSSIARPRRLLAGVGVMCAALFALVVATQGTAAFILQGCER